MLGIGQISTRIAELIRGALPYAIVNNDPNASRFTRLVAYSTVQQAIDAKHMWIKVAPGEYPGFTADVADMFIEGTWDTFINGGTTSDAIKITAGRVTVRNMKAATTGGAGNDYRAVYASAGTGARVENIKITDSDHSGIECASLASQLYVINCYIEDSDGSMMVLGGWKCMSIGNELGNSGGVGIYVDSGGDEALMVANHILGSSHSNAIEITSNADNCLCVANISDAAITDNSGTSTVANNKQY